MDAFCPRIYVYIYIRINTFACSNNLEKTDVDESDSIKELLTGVGSEKFPDTPRLFGKAGAQSPPSVKAKGRPLSASSVKQPRRTKAQKLNYYLLMCTEGHKGHNNYCIRRTETLLQYRDTEKCKDFHITWKFNWKIPNNSHINAINMATMLLKHKGTTLFQITYIQGEIQFHLKRVNIYITTLVFPS